MRADCDAVIVGGGTVRRRHSTLINKQIPPVREGVIIKGSSHCFCFRGDPDTGVVGMHLASCYCDKCHGAAYQECARPGCGKFKCMAAAYC